MAFEEVQGPVLSLGEILSCDFLFRLVLVGVVAYLIITLFLRNRKWLKTLEMMYNIQHKTLFIMAWVLFFIGLAFCWYKVGTFVDDLISRQLIDLLFGSVLILLVCWAVSFYSGHNFKLGKFFLVGAALVQIIATLYLWKFNTVVSTVMALVSLWVGYQAGVSLTIRRKCHEEEL